MMLDDNVIVMRIEEKLNLKRAITHAYSFLTFNVSLSSWLASDYNYWSKTEASMAADSSELDQDFRQLQ